MASSFELIIRFMDRFPLPAAVENGFLDLFRLAGRLRSSGLEREQRQAVEAEFSRMLSVFRVFREADRSPQLHSPPPARLPEFLQQAIGREDTSLQWLIEGAGYRYGHWLLQGKEPGFKSEDLLSQLPKGSARAFYMGVGLYVGHAYMGRWEKADREPAAVARDLDELAAHHPELVRYQAPVIDSTGFVLCLISPRALKQVDAALSQQQSGLDRHLWTGAGRAIYFRYPRALYPRGGDWPGVQRILAEAPRPSCREAALSGLGFAVTLINMGQPELLEDFIRKHIGSLSADPGFSDGVQEVLDMWHSLWGRDAVIQALSAHETPDLDADAAGYWLSAVREPARRILQGEAPAG